MMDRLNRSIVLKSRPHGIPSLENFELVETPLGPTGPGQVLIRNLFLSVDPAQKGWISATPNYTEPVALGEVMRAFTVGEVVESNHEHFAAGEIVLGRHGWQEYALSDGRSVIRKVDPALADLYQGQNSGKMLVRLV